MTRVIRDAVNVAARLYQLAPPGEVYVSGAVAEALRGQEHLELSPRGEHMLKGADSPVSCSVIE